MTKIFKPKKTKPLKGAKSLRDKQLKHNTITGTAPSATCRAFTGPQDFTTYHRPEPYSFRGKCSDGLFVDPKGKKGKGSYYYPCCQRLSEKAEKKHRMRLRDGYTAEGEAGTFVPGTLSLENRSFVGLQGLSLSNIIASIREVKPTVVSFTTPFVGRKNKPELIQYQYLTPQTIKDMAKGKSYAVAFNKHSEVMNYTVSNGVLTVTNNVGAVKKFAVTDTTQSSGRCVYSCDGHGKVKISTEGPIVQRQSSTTTIAPIKLTTNVGLMETLGKAKRGAMVLFVTNSGDGKSPSWYVFHKNRSACHFREKVLKLKITPTKHVTMVSQGQVHSAQANRSSVVEKDNKGFYHIGNNKHLVYLGGNYKEGVYNVEPSFLPNGSIALNKPYIIHSAVSDGESESQQKRNILEYLHAPLMLKTYTKGAYGLFVDTPDRNGNRQFYTSSGKMKLSTMALDVAV